MNPTGQAYCKVMNGGPEVLDFVSDLVLFYVSPAAIDLCHSDRRYQTDCFIAAGDAKLAMKELYVLNYAKLVGTDVDCLKTTVA